MAVLPFSVRRPGLLLKGIFTNRDKPDFARLSALTDPEQFLWAILPHAARTFSACIVVLPEAKAKAAAVGYLYARILDTYEDLMDDPVARRVALRHFVDRFTGKPGENLPPAPDAFQAARLDARDQCHVLLVQCSDRIDAVFHQLSGEHQEAVRTMVRAMAPAMADASDRFIEQGGYLMNDAQRAFYCDVVLGNPVAFGIRLAKGKPLTEQDREAARRTSLFIQMANITRDIEKDCLRGVAYHPYLKPWIGKEAPADEVAKVRAALLDEALRQAPDYLNLVDALEINKRPLFRASALLMLLFTHRYYLACAEKCGRGKWRLSVSNLRILWEAWRASISHRYAQKRMDFLVKDLANQAQETDQSLAPQPPSTAVAK